MSDLVYALRCWYEMAAVAREAGHWEAHRHAVREARAMEQAMFQRRQP